jgi:hypothetical protein
MNFPSDIQSWEKRKWVFPKKKFPQDHTLCSSYKPNLQENTQFMVGFYGLKRTHAILLFKF